MGCGSSRRLRVITPISKAMVLPIAWAGTNGQLKPILLRERNFPPAVHTGVQTETDPRVIDNVTQTDSSLCSESVWENPGQRHLVVRRLESVETQTPEAAFLELLKNIQIREEVHVAAKATEESSSKSADRIDFHLVNVGVQTFNKKSDISTQTFLNASLTLTSEHQAALDASGYSESSIFPKEQIAIRNSRTVASTVSKMLSTIDIESQTEPVIRAMAANSADSESAGVLYVSELMSPFAHLEKELGHPLQLRNDKKSKEAIQDSIAKLLLDVEDSLRHDERDDKVCREIGVQTDNDPITDESPEYAARPPPCKKLEMIPDMLVFEEIDKHAIEAPDSTRSSLRNLVNYLIANAKNELFKVRAFFRWIANNITYDWKYMDVKLSADEVLQRGEGVCKDYCKLFGEMCRLANIRVKRVHGFAKGYDYRPGHQFHPGEDITHAWNAVFIFGSWRLVDATWGTGYTDHTGKFQRKLNEHFFLTDPEVLIWTHFPYSEMESNYSRWQLLDKPIKLDEFNALPKVTPFFFEYNLRIRSRPQNPVIFRVQTELKIASHKPMRYKYKLYSADDLENGTLNNYVFCQLKEDRLLGSFAVSPPNEGRYYFKVYARPEWQMYEDTTLRNVAIFLLDCVRAKRYVPPYPMNDVPWGPTQSFFDFKMKLVNQPGPVIVTWGGKRKLVMEVNELMLITQQVFDTTGKELDNRGIVQREDGTPRTTLTITPPKIGYYKLLVFGMPKPKEKGKWRLPLLASFLIDCKLSKNPGDDDPYSTKKETKKKKMRIPTVR